MKTCLLLRNDNNKLETEFDTTKAIQFYKQKWDVANLVCVCKYTVSKKITTLLSLKRTLNTSPKKQAQCKYK